VITEGLQRKALTDLEWKADKAGAFRAVVATYNTVDRDGDVSIPGALDTSKSVIVSPWNHSSVDDARADAPIGAATITTVGDKAIADGHFYVNTELGRKAYEITKSLFDDGLGEWSYAFRIPPDGASTDSKDLAEWPGARRILKRVQPFEVSLVFAGAGIGTQTLSVKSAAEVLELKRGARLSKESRTRLRSLAADLLAFIGEAEEEPEPKSRKFDDEEEDLAGIPKLAPGDRARNEAEIQEFLRSASEAMERERSTRLIDLRFI
jgi:hypothetical protein